MKKYFITGLVILLPLAVTVGIIAFILDLLTKPFIGWVSDFLQRFHLWQKGFLFLTPSQIVKYGSQILIVACLILFTICLGIVTRWVFVKSIFKLSDRILHRIPLVSKVYKTTQEVIKTILTTGSTSFKQVVMAPFPQGGSYVIGLVSRESPKICSNQVGAPLISVLIPTTPNPTTGFLIMYKKDDLIFLNLTVEDAIKYIVSCGMITPPPTTLSSEEESNQGRDRN